VAQVWSLWQRADMQTALVKFPAKRLASFLAILFVIGLQLAILFTPQIEGDPYRRHERIEAFMAWHQNPSDTTKAALDRERQLEDQHTALVAALRL
jgi:hypothetical protein